MWWLRPSKAEQGKTEPEAGSSPQPSTAGNASTTSSEAFCSSQFPEMWGNWVNHFIDHGFNGVGTAAGPDAKQEVRPSLPLRLPPAARLVAIGDVHGDLSKATRALELAGVVNEEGRWSGGDTVVVQVGDVLDRGDAELRILYLLERLQVEAAAAGGALHVLNGNHETMNIMGAHRYATPGATQELLRWQRWQELGARLKAQCGCSTSDFRPIFPEESPAGMGGSSRDGSGRDSVRAATLSPGTPITRRFFARHPTVLQVGSNVFVHGGVLPEHVEHGLERINSETQSWMLNGQPQDVPSFLTSASAIVWARDYSTEDEAKCNCSKLQDVLQSIPGSARMIVGHTIQKRGVNSACGGRVMRVDVGMSSGCGDREVEVLEILGDSQVRRLRAGQSPQPMESSTVAGKAGQQASSPIPASPTKTAQKERLAMEQ